MKKNNEKLSSKENIIQVVKFVAFSLGSGVIQTVTFTILNELFKFDYWQSLLSITVFLFLHQHI